MTNGTRGNNAYEEGGAANHGSSRTHSSFQARSEKKARRPMRAPWPVRIVNDWWDRLISATVGKTLNTQGQLYDSGRTMADYVLNTAGLAAWGVLFPMLTIIATRLAGTDGAGAFSLAFTTATLLMYVGSYGVRTYQVSDVDETESFASYLLQRILTCLIMLVAVAAYCSIRGAVGDELLIIVGACGYRAVDACADVFEGRMQQVDKLYLAGISLLVRSVLGVVSFAVLLLITRSLAVASLSMAISAVVSFVLLTLPLTLLETPRSRPWAAIELREIFVECLPAASAIVLFALIEAVPKYAMEGVLPYDSQIYFNAIYFPAQSVLMIVGFVYKPQLLRIANIWADRDRRGRFNLIIIAMVGVAVVVTLAMLFIGDIALIPLNGILYATSFESYREAQRIMIIAGGMSAVIDFLYQILTVLRRQSVATLSYVGALVLGIVASLILVRLLGFMGAVWAYAAVMAALLALLSVQYVLVRMHAEDTLYG